MEASSRRYPPCCVNNKCEHLKDLIYKSYALPFLVECSKSPPSHTKLPLCPFNFHQNMWDYPWRYMTCLGTLSPFWLGRGSDKKIQCKSLLPPQLGCNSPRLPLKWHPFPYMVHYAISEATMVPHHHLAISVQWVGEPRCNSGVQKWREKERAVQYLHPTTLTLTHLRGALPFPTQPQSQSEKEREREKPIHCIQPLNTTQSGLARKWFVFLQGQLTCPRPKGWLCEMHC